MDLHIHLHLASGDRIMALLDDIKAEVSTLKTKVDALVAGQASGVKDTDLQPVLDDIKAINASIPDAGTGTGGTDTGGGTGPGPFPFPTPGTGPDVTPTPVPPVPNV